MTKGRGRFGPFIKWNNFFINVNNKFDFGLSQKNIEFLIEDKLKRKKKVIKVWEDENIKIEKARWGRFKGIYDKGFVELSKDSDPSKLSLIEVKKIINDKKSNRTNRKRNK